MLSSQREGAGLVGVCPDGSPHSHPPLPVSMPCLLSPSASSWTGPCHPNPMCFRKSLSDATCEAPALSSLRSV